MYVTDKTNSGMCATNTECFIQVLAINTFSNFDSFSESDVVTFSGNTAAAKGFNIYGGTLDRYISSLFAEIYREKRKQYSGVNYLEYFSNVKLESISSLPV